MDSERTEIVFFDLETTIPKAAGQGHAILEFGAILVCPKKLVELDSFSSLVRPSDLTLISTSSVRCNGITRDAVASAPSFVEIADKIHDLLHGRIWAGHNILRFDCPRIREAFAEIGRTPPEPKNTIDSLTLLTQKFGRRAGDMKMASLANYFGLGQQSHRSLDDVRMNLEVLKSCAMVLFLESTLPDIFTSNSWVSPNATTRSRGTGRISTNGTIVNSAASRFTVGNGPFSSPIAAGINPTLFSSFRSRSDEVALRPDSFDLGSLCNEIIAESIQEPDVSMEENRVISSEVSPTADQNSAGFVEIDEVSIVSISASFVPFYRGSQKMKILHNEVILQLCCAHLNVRFGISTKFVDHAGRPRLSFVVDTSPTLYRVLDACDDVAKKLFMDSGCSSEWRPVVMRKNGYLNAPTIRLNIPTVVDGEVAMYGTEMYHKESSGTAQKLVFSRIDVAELETLFVPGTRVDAYFSLDPYDYQLSAGIRLVAKKLIIHSSKEHNK